MTAVAPDTRPVTSPVAERADFSAIRYAQAWEDPRSLERALAPGADDTVLSIAAAGDNSLALVAMGAGRVVAVDMNPSQVALGALKRAAILGLEHDELLRFSGAVDAPATERLALLDRLLPELEPAQREFWNASRPVVAAGIIHAGRLEGMWRTFRTRVMPLLHGRETIAAAFEPRTPDERERFWRERWASRRWRLAIRLFFSEFVIARTGRDPAFFEHVQLSASEHYAGRARHAFVELDPATNPFLQYILLGTYLDPGGDDGPPWLQRRLHGTLRERADRLELRVASLEEAVAAVEPGTFSAFNLSDIFEWMDEAHHEATMRSIVASARPGARIAYWNNLVPRACPQSLRGIVEPDDELAAQVHAADRSFLYRAFHLDRVVGDPGEVG